MKGAHIIFIIKFLLQMTNFVNHTMGGERKRDGHCWAQKHNSHFDASNEGTKCNDSYL